MCAAKLKKLSTKENFILNNIHRTRCVKFVGWEWCFSECTMNRLIACCSDCGTRRALNLYADQAIKKRSVCYIYKWKDGDA